MPPIHLYDPLAVVARLESKQPENCDDIDRHVVVVDFDQLTPCDHALWESIRATRPEFRTPFFSVGFSRAVHFARGDVLVAMLKRGAETVGFFPFHRVRKIAVPVGRFFNDAHNIITRPDETIDWMWLLEQCQVKAFDFHAMVGADATSLAAHCHGTIGSFRADIGDDSVEYLARLGKQHVTIGRQPQKTRKMHREIGPVQLEFDCRDPKIRELAIQWKRQQYRRTHILDLFGPSWTRRMVTALHEGFDGESHFVESADSTKMHGLLSVLRAGDTIVAAHYGIREGDLLHYWFPAFNAEYSRFSPGTALYRELISAASAHGVRCIDMGYGEQPYKLKQTDTVTSVSFGCISRSKLHGFWRSMETKAVSILKRMPMKDPLKRCWRRLQPQAGISKLR